MTAESKKKWWASAIKRFGSEEAVRAHMAASAKKAEHAGEGGFKYMKQHDPERLRTIAKQGGRVGKRTRQV